MVDQFWFWISLGFMVVHELDAIRCKEWRIFPGLSSLGDGLGSKIFIIAHIPLFILLFFGLRSSVVHSYLVVGLDFFFIIHIFLHLAFYKHPENKFKDIYSWLLIIVCGVGGFLDLLFF